MTDPRLAKYQRRRRVNQIALFLSLSAMAFGLVWLIWILWETLWRGVGGLQLSVLTQMTPAPNEEGGLGQCHLRIFFDGVAVHLRGNAYWHSGWHLLGRIQPA